jgi:hypothetical protein
MLSILLCSSHKHVLEYIFRHKPGVVVVVVVGGVVVGGVVVGSVVVGSVVVGGVVVGSVVVGAVVVLVSVRMLHVKFKGLIIWSLSSRRLVVATTTKPNLSHLASALEVAEGHTIPF